VRESLQYWLRVIIWLKPLHISRHGEERSDEAIHTSAGGAMDCFAQPVIGRAFARPVGSQ
jgi:hypothetical protein